MKLTRPSLAITRRNDAFASPWSGDVTDDRMARTNENSYNRHSSL
jgi:hypothetical protein